MTEAGPPGITQKADGMSGGRKKRKKKDEPAV